MMSNSRKICHKEIDINILSLSRDELHYYAMFGKENISNKCKKELKDRAKRLQDAVDKAS